MSSFRLQRSAATPAGSANRATGRMRANETTPAFAAEPVTPSTSSGYAIVVACVPAFDSNWPNCSSMKSRLRCSGPLATRRR
jgi:hypothetical protein